MNKEAGVNVCVVRKSLHRRQQGGLRFHWDEDRAAILQTLTHFKSNIYQTV